MEREYKIAITIIAEQKGDYRSPGMKKILSTGFTNIDDAVMQVNEVIHDKLGINERIELTRNHRAGH
jgi:hypothetical protein